MTKTNMHFRLKTKTKSKIAAKINTGLKAEGKVPEVREELRTWRRNVMMEGEMV